MEFLNIMSHFLREFTLISIGSLFLWFMLALLVTGIHAVLTDRTERLTHIKTTILVVIGLNFFWAISIYYSASDTLDPALSAIMLTNNVKTILLTGFMAAFTFSLVFILEIIRSPEQVKQDRAFGIRETALGCTTALLGALTIIVLSNSMIDEYNRSIPKGSQIDVEALAAPGEFSLKSY